MRKGRQWGESASAGELARKAKRGKKRQQGVGESVQAPVNLSEKQKKRVGGSLGKHRSRSAGELEGKVDVGGMGKRESLSASELNQKVGGRRESAEDRRA